DRDVDQVPFAAHLDQVGDAIVLLDSVDECRVWFAHTHLQGGNRGRTSARILPKYGHCREAIQYAMGGLSVNNPPSLFRKIPPAGRARPCRDNTAGTSDTSRCGCSRRTASCCRTSAVGGPRSPTATRRSSR